MKDTNISDRIFILSPGSYPRGGTWRCLGVKNSMSFIHLSVMLSPPKPLDQIQPNLVCELLTCIGCATSKKYCPTPRRGQKVQYHLILITKSISKIFYTKLFVCSHKLKIQNISDGIFILSPGSCSSGGIWGYLGLNSVRPTVMLSPPEAVVEIQTNLVRELLT